MAKNKTGSPASRRRSSARPLSEREIDAMANDGRLSALAVRMAIDAGVDWPSQDEDAQDAWHEAAIAELRRAGGSR